MMANDAAEAGGSPRGVDDDDFCESPRGGLGLKRPQNAGVQAGFTCPDSVMDRQGKAQRRLPMKDAYPPFSLNGKVVQWT